MPSYVGFIRGCHEAQSEMSPSEMQRTLERYIAWSDEMQAADRLVAGGGLARSGGRVLRMSGGELTSTAGPHTEATEIVGGFIVIEADDEEHAAKLFGTHPHLEFGPIELRKVGERGCEP